MDSEHQALLPNIEEERQFIGENFLQSLLPIHHHEESEVAHAGHPLRYLSPADLLGALEHLRVAVAREGDALFQRWRPGIERKAFLISGHNLAHYLAFRHRDLRELQAALAPFGLSTLGRSEGKVLSTLDAVITTLRHITGKESAAHAHPNHFNRGDRMLEYHADAVFGPPPSGRGVRIMVTLPSDAADNPQLARDLIAGGVDCVRINCAHDTPEAWARMIEHVRNAAIAAGRTCKVHMDIAGPKIRTDEVVIPKGRSRVRKDDTILLARQLPAEPRTDVFVATCAMPEVLEQVKVGASVWIDDGKIGAVVTEIVPEGLLLRVNHVRARGEQLRPEKGINFPDSDLRVNPLTTKDLDDLNFVAAYADIVGYSFVQHTEDIEQLHAELKARGRDPKDIAVIAKIETRRAVENLPELIVAAAGKQPFGVMIARGDLAVEIGFERLAEIQEEILWICEAAHVPVVWATQVLERLVKKGIPSRSEMTDAAMGERAECVMLNKGPYILEGVAVLDDVLKRMETHLKKKTPQLRALKSW